MNLLGIIRTINNPPYLINKGHNLALIANYLVREHAETVGETTKQLNGETEGAPVRMAA